LFKQELDRKVQNHALDSEMKEGYEDSYYEEEE